jgi:hypothetical protein
VCVTWTISDQFRRSVYMLYYVYIYYFILLPKRLDLILMFDILYDMPYIFSTLMNVMHEFSLLHDRMVFCYQRICIQQE